MIDLHKKNKFLFFMNLKLNVKNINIFPFH